MGYWTPDYLREKLRRLRHPPRIPLILCINCALNCGSGDLPEQARVVWFQKRIDPANVLTANKKPDLWPQVPSRDTDNTGCLMTKPPVLKPREVVAILEALGFEERRQRGS
jgi:hypothetical protein